MTINRVTLAGFAGKDARTSSTQNGKRHDEVVRRDNEALQRRAKASGRRKRNGTPALRTGSTADYAAKIQTGDHVFIEGELVYREYERTIETDSGPVKVQWPVTEIVIESISVLDRKDKQERKGAA